MSGRWTGYALCGRACPSVGAIHECMSERTCSKSSSKLPGTTTTSNQQLATSGPGEQRPSGGRAPQPSPTSACNEGGSILGSFRSGPPLLHGYGHGTGYPVISSSLHLHSFISSPSLLSSSFPRHITCTWAPSPFPLTLMTTTFPPPFFLLFLLAPMK